MIEVILSVVFNTFPKTSIKLETSFSDNTSVEVILSSSDKLGTTISSCFSSSSVTNFLITFEALILSFASTNSPTVKSSILIFVIVLSSPKTSHSALIKAIDSCFEITEPSFASLVTTISFCSY